MWELIASRLTASMTSQKWLIQMRTRQGLRKLQSLKTTVLMLCPNSSCLRQVAWKLILPEEVWILKKCFRMLMLNLTETIKAAALISITTTSQESRSNRNQWRRLHPRCPVSHVSNQCSLIDTSLSLHHHQLCLPNQTHKLITQWWSRIYTNFSRCCQRTKTNLKWAVRSLNWT